MLQFEAKDAFYECLQTLSERDLAIWKIPEKDDPDYLDPYEHPPFNTQRNERILICIKNFLNETESNIYQSEPERKNEFILRRIAEAETLEKERNTGLKLLKQKKPFGRNYYILPKTIQDINALRLLIQELKNIMSVKTPNDTLLSHRQIALIYIYSRKKINGEGQAQEIAHRYGHTSKNSGKILNRAYKANMDTEERLRIANSKKSAHDRIADIEAVLEHLTEEGKNTALEEKKTLERKYPN